MSQIRSFINQLKDINPKGADFYNFFISNGSSYDSGTVSGDNKLIMNKYFIRARSKSCFCNAQQLTIYSEGEYEYCEGYAISKVLGIPMEHAWNVKKGKIIDLTWDDGMEYFGVKVPYKWIKNKFYEFVFKHNVSEAQLLRYYEEVKDERIHKDSTKEVPRLSKENIYSLQ